MLFDLVEKVLGWIKKRDTLRVIRLQGELFLAKRMVRSNKKDPSAVKSFNIFRPNIVLVIQEPTSTEIIGRLSLDQFDDGSRFTRLELKGGLIRKLKRKSGKGEVSFSYSFSVKEDRLIVRLCHE